MTKVNAPAMITRCQTALNTLNGLYDSARMDTLDTKWFDFHGGLTLLLLASAYVVENDNKLSVTACENALGAKDIWSRIDAPPGSGLESDIKNNALFNKLVPLCMEAFNEK